MEERKTKKEICTREEERVKVNQNKRSERERGEERE